MMPWNLESAPVPGSVPRRMRVPPQWCVALCMKYGLASLSPSEEKETDDLPKKSICMNNKFPSAFLAHGPNWKMYVDSI